MWIIDHEIYISAFSYLIWRDTFFVKSWILIEIGKVARLLDQLQNPRPNLYWTETILTQVEF
jgi:hypothetical protein